MTIAEAKKLIRKALAEQLSTAVTAAGITYLDTGKPSIQWVGLSFDRNKLLERARVDQKQAEYVRFSNHIAKIDIVEMGSTPRIEAHGFAKIGIFTQVGAGEDRNDTIAGIIGAAYPYNTELERDGIRVTIGRQVPGDAVPDETWLYSPLDVYWDVWRT